MRLRIVVVDDNPECLQRVKAALANDFSVVASAPDGLAALEAIRKLKPDVAVVDLQMPGLNGIEVTQELMRLRPAPAVIICSVHRDRQLIQAAADAGALGYVFKTDGCHDLVAAVKTVASGSKCFPLVNKIHLP
jgi:DNA-binding NarL/FixJ family response regulator